VFLKVQAGLSGIGQTVLMRQPGGRVMRVQMPIVLDRPRGMRGLGVTCPTGLVQAANGGCIDPGYAPNKNVAAASPKAVTYASAPGCNVVNLASNECMLDDGTITGCNIIQQCDSLTGNARCQYGPFPGQAADPSLPFCSGSGPSVSYTPNLSLTNPTGPSTPFTPTALAPNAVPVGSSPTAAQVKSLLGQTQPTSSTAASSPAASPTQPSSQTNFLQQLLAGPNPPAGGSTTAVASSDSSLFSGSLDVFGMQIPYWLIGVVVVGGGILLMSGGKK
jgi:hypothetical protein